ncbi:MAG: protein translocase subunit SecF [Candidatus Cloacimonadota bacterium]|nr:protein translocase subunit SecF [Candidatus Cloacimonadota bacterium]
MQFFKETKIEFVNKRRTAFILSLVIIVSGLISMIFKGGLNYGIDFTGGVSIELDLTPTDGEAMVQVDDLRDALKKNGVKDSSIQTISSKKKTFYLIQTKGTQSKNEVLISALQNSFPGNDEKDVFVVDNEDRTLQVKFNEEQNRATIKKMLVKNGFSNARIDINKDNKKIVTFITESTSDEGNRIIEIVKKEFPKYAKSENLIRKQDTVGPKIGSELKGKAILAIIYSLLGIILYIWWRFEFTYGVAAVIALFHDVLITLGLFSIFNKEISLAVVAALLTIVGYSLNDTIVVFDRIRENFKNSRRDKFDRIINNSINDTISRTVITSLTTFAVVLSLFLFGGNVIHDFAFAILIGVVIGTYSSIFIASPVLVEYYNKKHKR